MKIQDSDTALELHLVRLNDDQQGVASDPEFHVFARSGTFSGTNESVHVLRSDWNAFINGLEGLESVRSGKARLISMDPDEFELTVQATDHAGHIAAVGWLSGYILARDARPVISRVAFALQIEPSTLPRLVSSFRSLTLPTGLEGAA